MSLVQIKQAPDKLTGKILLDGSKSISNRALIALSLANAQANTWLSNCSHSKDTQILSRLLDQKSSRYDAGDAGTTFRFMTAFLALKPGEQILTGSERMQQRPIGPLVEALQQLGTPIEYLAEPGYPPLKIGQIKPQGPKIDIASNLSSQFISALLLIGPYLPQGLELNLVGAVVSRPYIDMTIQLMRHFGASLAWKDNVIQVNPGAFTARPLKVEADWSAASYWYAMASLAPELDLCLIGLQEKSLQGDAKLALWMEKLGVRSEFNEQGVCLKKQSAKTSPFLELDFLECPDIAPTFIFNCAALGMHGLFSGLDTLHIKETDRIQALKTELNKIGVQLSKLPARMYQNTPDKTYYSLSGSPQKEGVPRFATYGDHRMAMSPAMLAFLGPLEIEDPSVVDKSYPGFWRDLASLGFELNLVSA